MTQYRPLTSSPEPPSGGNRRLFWLVGGCLVLFLCFGCLMVGGFSAGLYAYWQTNEGQVENGIATEAAWDGRSTRAAEAVPMPTLALPAATPEPVQDDTLADVPVTAVPINTPPAIPATPLDFLSVPAEINQTAMPDRAFADLEQIYITHYPARDYYEAAARLDQYTGPRTITGQPYALGERRTFYNDSDRIEATLTAVTEHTYFWVEDGLNLDAAEVAAAANRFETDYYERLVNLFGQMWAPGVDNDPRFSVLHVSSTSADELGYFRNEDEYPQELFNLSNEQEIIYLNMGELDLGEDLYYATLVHEVQHLIQWNVDASESAWLNEGLSQLAEIYLGFTDTADTIDYLENPHTRLNDWSYEDDTVYAHYAAAYLFLVYMWEQLGETAVQELARHPADGMSAVRAILQGYAPETTLAQFTANWAAANYLDDAEVEADTRYFYQNLDLRRPDIHSKAEGGETLELVESLAQFGVHYINLNELRGPTTISFAGDTTTALIDAATDDGNVFWYAPAVDETNARLTAVYDLSNTTEADLSYSVWYDLEEDYDFAYVSVSTDGGATWQLLTPEHDSSGDYGRAYNGRSADEPAARNGWLKETLSLNAYVGQPIHIRFDVITDSGITGQGFAVDNITLTDYQTATFTEGAEGWQAEGFVLSGGWLPQEWSVLLIEEGTETAVTSLPLDALNRGQWSLEIGKRGGVLVIMPQTPFVQNPARYWLNVTQ